jgi:mono/diheme cytochrome c family protein
MGAFGFPEPKMRALVAYVAGVAGGRVKDTGADEPEAVRAGERVFRENCEGCHAIDGREANGRFVYPGTDFNKVKPSQKMVREQVLKGAVDGEVMPSFRGRLSEQELHNLAVYVTATAGR